MRAAFRFPARLSMLLAAVMAVQAGLALAFPSAYRDEGWIRSTWAGNDGVTLACAAPLLVLGVFLARRGSIRGFLLWFGVLGYAVHNYAFYLLGAALNAFFPVYVVAVLLINARDTSTPSPADERARPLLTTA